MLSRTQPRPSGEPRLPLDAIQNRSSTPTAALPDGVAPRILASRTAFVADSHAHALQVAEPGLRKQATQHRAAGHTIEGDSVTDYLQQLDAHVGDPEHVVPPRRRTACWPAPPIFRFRCTRSSLRTGIRCVPLS